MYIITSVICNISSSGMKIQNEQASKDMLLVMKLIFTPINSLIVLSCLGNTFCKLKDEIINSEKAGKRFIILSIIFVLIFAMESSYIGNFESSTQETIKKSQESNIKP